MNVTQDAAVGLVEIESLTAAIVCMDQLEKAADVRIDHYELNDYYGVCIRVRGRSDALQVALVAAEQTAARLNAPLRQHLLHRPADQTWRVIQAQPEYQPLLEQPAVFFPVSPVTETDPNSDPGDNAMSEPYAIGIIETQGFTAVLTAIDTACKAANVEVVGKEKLGGGYITIIIRGDVAAVRAAVDAGTAEVEGLGTLIASHVIARPSPSVLSLLPTSG